MKWKRPSRKPRPPLRTKEDVLREAKELEEVLARLFRRWRARHGTPLEEIAAHAGVCDETVRNIENQEKGMTIRSFLGMSLSHGREMEAVLRLARRCQRWIRRGR